MAAILHVIFDFYELKNTLFFKKSKLTQIYYYEPQSAGINVQSPQKESTPRRLTLGKGLIFFGQNYENLIIVLSNRHALPKTETPSKQKTIMITLYVVQP